MGLMMSVFLFSLAGVPPFAGWFAKFTMFRAALDANTPGATVLGAIAAVSSVVAFFYYVRVVAWRSGSILPPRVSTPHRSRRRSRSNAAVVLCAGVVLVIGVYPQLFARLGELAAGG